MKIRFENNWGRGDFNLITIEYNESMFNSIGNTIYFLIFNIGFSIEFNK